MGFECEKYEEYYLPGSRGEKFKSIPYPKEFSSVANSLLKVCGILGAECSVHPSMPGIQWVNNRDNVEEAKKVLKLYMRNLGNHYFHSIDPKENINYPLEDKYYCMCQEWKSEQTAYLTLKGMTDTEFQDYHGKIYTGENMDRHIGENLKKKIVEDSIEFLAQEYKIHLQPKPEYQIPVLQELVNLISTELLNVIEAWKAIIPYDRVLSDMKLPSIVIYPVGGAKNAEFVIHKIIERFSKYDVKEIGLNVTPRYNYKYNELIYWAGGSGDHKIHLDEKYFNNKEKNFYKGYEIY